MVYIKKTRFDVDAIREDTDVEAVLDFCNIKHRKKGEYTFIECPEHEENLGKRDNRLGNCWIRDKSYYCSACGGHGDMFKLVMKTLDVNFPKACSIIAEISIGNANIYSNDLDVSEEALTYKKHKLLYPEIFLDGKRPQIPNTPKIRGCILKEVYTLEEVEAYEESGYRVTKIDDDTWLVFTKEKPMSLLDLMKENPQAYNWLINQKIKEKKSFLRYMDEYTECILDPLLYKCVKNEIKEQKERLHV